VADLAVLGSWLDSMIFRVCFNLNDSMTVRVLLCKNLAFSISLFFTGILSFIVVFNQEHRVFILRSAAK